MKCPSPLASLLAVLALAPIASTSSHPPRAGLFRPSRLAKVSTDTPENPLDFLEREKSTGLALRDGDEKHSLSKRGGFSGRATFFSVGVGACGGTSSDSDFIVAMNMAQYGDSGAVSPLCFKTITISYGEKSTQAQVMDACPGCPYGGLDMSPGLFRFFASESVGVIYVSWSLGSGDSPSTTAAATTSPTSTTSTTSTTFSSTWVAPSTTSSSPTTTSSPSTSAPPSSRSSVASSSASASSSSIASSTSSTLGNAASLSPIAPPSDLVGGNLDALNQIIIALGGLIGGAAQAA